MLESRQLPSLKEIMAAQERVKGVAVRTPLVESPSLSKSYGRHVFLKLECFQPIRVFKIRGAYNKISRLSEKKIVAVSSGNHGLAVAYCSHLLDKKCTVVLPETAVEEKVNAIVEFGGEPVKFGKFRKEGEAEEKAKEIIREKGGVLVHPFNDPDIIAGTGTIGLEITEQLRDIDSVVVPVGGGGLISGVAIAVKSLSPRTKVFGVEPDGAPKMTAALKEGKVVDIGSPTSIADGLNPSRVGDLTLEACRRYVDGMITVSDEGIIRATKLLIREAHIFPEPSGAASAAALLQAASLEKLGERVVFVVSGGNVSVSFLAKMLA
jgi:threonine dehydratase